MTDEMDNVKSLEKVICKWLLEHHEREFLVGDETARNMARAALAVLDAVRDMNEFFERKQG